MIKIYKKYVSFYIPKSCRFVPTCSEYATTAIEQFGILRGLVLALYRVARCNPFSRGGYDPVIKNNLE